MSYSLKAWAPTTNPDARPDLTWHATHDKEGRAARDELTEHLRSKGYTVAKFRRLRPSR